VGGFPLSTKRSIIFIFNMENLFKGHFVADGSDTLITLRIHLAQRKYQFVIKEIGPQPTSTETRCLALLATYLQAKDANNDAAMAQVVASVEAERESHVSGNAAILLASVFYHEERLEDALLCLEKHPKHLECNALAIQCYLAMHQTDLAKQLVDSCKAFGEDDVICQLGECWYQLVSAGKAQSAFYAYEEIGGSSPSVAMLNAQAVAQLALGRFEEASSLLQQCMDQGTDANVLVNTAVNKHLNGASMDQTASLIKYSLRGLLMCIVS
jgi:coatomer protein complex subunit epsilon